MFHAPLPSRRLFWLVVTALLMSLWVTSGLAKDKPATDKDKPAFELSKEEQALLDLTNKERAKAELPPLKANEKLFKAARAHTENMAKQNKLDHTLDDKGPGDRLKDVGYEHAGWGENVAGGPRTPEEAVETWMNSEGHKANILNPNFKEIGLGIAKSGDGGMYYTQVFGIPRSP